MYQDLLQYIFSGLTSGAIYALIALGFCVVNNTMGIVNFVQVDFVSLGGMLMFSALFALGLPMVPGLLFAVAGVAAVAMVVERFGLRPARTENHLVLIFITVGLSIILRGIIKLVWGKNRMAVPPLTPDTPVNIMGASVLPQALWILLLTVIAIALLMFFFYRTSLGLCMRAVACNPSAAAVVGIPAGRVRLTSYAIAGALGGLAGVLVTPITTLSYDVGVLLGLKGFAAAILGGFGSFPGAILGGLGLGLLESLSAGYISSAYKDVVAFVVLLLVLCVRPNGLMGK
ncbi:branched-chain amino acid ABC transporter permease [Desulfofustis glycolicus]|uniref:Amino acid/amide ABC transporter membrane protein 1, HAAT family n=1 Tax=Desulfofustis glycolicus DSM 9705 TaxID=1121409 RepID=A0A1M5YQP3_9BACT|nr:branched-chain amino acid ABC transporter permease [Desulfofustis glycolicus]MCB2215837.1 branched-chain amino acid ABC transporter permease [Desulfobulbaceae bacterium]SHI14405.1 amino acid/amide ABC transporter membrane protein 1, HAAT family [Desulfofustis glycolicus DSM 9705]